MFLYEPNKIKMLYELPSSDFIFCAFNYRTSKTCCSLE